jgi:hypothetical protein
MPRLLQTLLAWDSRRLRQEVLRSDKSSAALELVRRRFGGDGIEQPQPFELAKVKDRLAAALRKKTFVDLSSRDLRYVPYVIFDESGEIADSPNFRHLYRETLYQRLSSRIARMLAMYLVNYYPDRKRFSFFYELSQELLKKCGNKRCEMLFSSLQKIGFYSDAGPALLAKKITDSDLDAVSFPQSVDLTEKFLHSSFYLEALHHLLPHLRKWVESKVSNEAEFRKWLGYFLLNEKSFRFAEIRIELVASILSPFVYGNMTDAAEKREYIKPILLNLYGDPRLDKSKWFGVDEDIVRVVFRWLTEGTIRDFIRLLEFEAKRSNNDQLKRHWRYRARFIEAYLDAELVDDAWVILGKNLIGSRELKDLNLGSETYGKFNESSPNFGPYHAAIMLKIGDVLMVDRNYNGSCLFWDLKKDSASAPKRYEPTYRSFDRMMTNAPVRMAHNQSENYGWQYEFAQYIRQSTGISMPQSNYTVQ